MPRRVAGGAVKWIERKMKVEGLFHIIHSEGQKVARWRRLPGCCCRRWCWSSRFIVLAGRRVRVRAIATIEFGPELLPTSHPLTSSSTSNRGLKSNTSISHHQHTMTITETVKDAVGLGHGGPSARTSNTLFRHTQHHQAHMRHLDRTAVGRMRALTW